MPRFPFHVIYNQDCTNLFAITKEPLEPRHVIQMVDEVVDGGADVMLINPNAQRVNYPSKVWQTFWDGYEPGTREFFGPVPAEELPGREAWVRQMQRLALQGCDYLAEALGRCRARGIHPGVSIRMNDMHDVPWLGSHLFSEFYLNNPQLRLDNPPVCGWAATGLDYRHPAVHAHYLALIRELVAGYDFEVLELDFLRFGSYFPREHFAEHCTIMTGFLREVRAVLAGASRPIALIPRIATTPTAAYELGFDPASWAREGLIDGLTMGAMLNSSWQMPIDAYRALVGADIPLYPCTDLSADRRDGLPLRPLVLDEPLLRGFAAGYLAAGADGIALFNFFCSREEGWGQSRDPYFHMLKEMHSLSVLRGQPKRYVLTSGVTAVEIDGPMQVPVPVPTHAVRAFYLWLAAEPAAIPVTVEVVVTATDPLSKENFWLSLNDTPLGSADSLHTESIEKQPTQTITFTAPASVVRDGRNSLTFRNEGAPVSVLGIDVCCG